MLKKRIIPIQLLINNIYDDFVNLVSKKRRSIYEEKSNNLI